MSKQTTPIATRYEMISNFTARSLAKSTQPNAVLITYFRLINIFHTIFVTFCFAILIIMLSPHHILFFLFVLLYDYASSDFRFSSKFYPNAWIHRNVVFCFWFQALSSIFLYQSAVSFFFVFQIEFSKARSATTWTTKVRNISNFFYRFAFFSFSVGWAVCNRNGENVYRFWVFLVDALIECRNVVRLFLLLFVNPLRRLIKLRICKLFDPNVWPPLEVW